MTTTHADVTTASDSVRPISAVIVLAAVVSATLLAAPGVVGALIAGYGFTPAQAGYTIAVEQACMAIAALPAIWWVRRFDRGRVVRACLCATIILNLLCTATRDFGPIAILRGLTGLAGGSVMATCLAVVGVSRQRERNFALWAIGQLVLGASALIVLPTIPAEHRAQAFFVALAVLLAVALPMAAWLSRAKVNTQGTVTRLPINAGSMAALAAVLMFYVAIGGVWTFLERIGLQDGVAPQTVASDLSRASVAGICGCLCAAWLGGKLGRTAPLCVGYGLLISTMGLLSYPIAPQVFAAGSSAFVLAWLFSLPFLLTVVAERDPTGRLSVLANLMIGAGLGFGPALFAATLSTPPDYRHVLPHAFAAASVSLGLALWAIWMSRPPRAA